MTDVYLWNGDDTIPDAVENDRAYITEIVNHGWVPAYDSIFVGLTNASPVREDATIQALGVVRSTTRVSSGRQRVRLEPLLFIEPVQWSAFLSSQEGETHQDSWEQIPQELRPHALSRELTSSLITFLEHDPEIAAWLENLNVAVDVESDVLEIFNESRDAIGLAVEIAGLGGPPPSPFRTTVQGTDTSDVIASVIKNAHLADAEEDLIPVDLLRFEEGAEVKQIAGHAAILRGYDYELIVFNVNKKPLEVALGVDLVYWDTVNGTFTLIQYKRLDAERVPEGRVEWMYKSEAEITRQLELMIAPPEDPTLSSNWRMASPYWFKFVRRDAAQADDTKLLRGMYVAADYLRLAVQDGSFRSGPRGGFRIGYFNTKRVQRSTFVELIKAGLIGTRAVQSADLVSIIGDLTSGGRNAIVAMKRRWQLPSTGELDVEDLFSRDTGTDSGSVMDFDDLLASKDDERI